MLIDSREGARKEKKAKGGAGGQRKLKRRESKEMEDEETGKNKQASAEDKERWGSRNR